MRHFSHLHFVLGLSGLAIGCASTARHNGEESTTTAGLATGGAGGAGGAPEVSIGGSAATFEEMGMSGEGGGVDGNCDGASHNTNDAACACIAGETRPCEEHPGLDGEGPCRAGSQTCLVSVDGSSSSWGDCVGSVGPAAQDSCSVVGDDGNCNGEPNDACDCESDADCDDGVACTTDSCADLVCEHPIEPGFCRIGGECIAHNAPDPTNSCRFCDATLNQTGWTSAAPGTSCDDGLWCTGKDTCTGGTCQHEFSGHERCSGSGPCALDACDESRDSCYAPAGTVCANVVTINRCVNDVCGGSSEAVELTRACTGDSPECPTEENEEVVSTTSCTIDQACNGSTGRCGVALGCGDSYCDPTGSGLCWMNTDAPGTFTQAEAITYCENLVLAGSDNWHLPSLDEGRSIYRDCDGRVMTCPVGEGPGVNGCYWPNEMGTCEEGYWSSEDSPFPMFWLPDRALVTIGSQDAFLPVRCATTDG